MQYPSHDDEEIVTTKKYKILKIINIKYQYIEQLLCIVFFLFCSFFNRVMFLFFPSLFLVFVHYIFVSCFLRFLLTLYWSAIDWFKFSSVVRIFFCLVISFFFLIFVILHFVKYFLCSINSDLNWCSLFIFHSFLCIFPVFFFKIFGSCFSFFFRRIFIRSFSFAFF